MWYIFSFLWGLIHSVGQGWVDIFNKSLISGTLTLFWTDLLRRSGTCSARDVELWRGLHRCSTNHKNWLSILPFTQASPLHFAILRESYREVNGGSKLLDLCRCHQASSQLQINDCLIHNWKFKISRHRFIAKFQEEKVIQYITGMIGKWSWIWGVGFGCSPSLHI